jgi:hypothetical protein
MPSSATRHNIPKDDILQIYVVSTAAIGGFRFVNSTRAKGNIDGYTVWGKQNRMPRVSSRTMKGRGKMGL